MEFVERQLQFTFSGEHVGTLSVSGLRAFAAIQAIEGRLGVSAQVRIWGLSLAQMNTYSSRLSSGVGIEQFSLVIEAGDIGGTLHKVIDAPIWRSFIDLSGAPESAFDVTVSGTLYQSAKPRAAQAQRGAQAAEALIQAICNVSGLTLHNNGAHAMLTNHATYGSAIDQIEDIARAARFRFHIDGAQVFLWPPGSHRDEIVIDVGPAASTRMVGYPRWWEAGLIVETLFNADIQVGRQLNVTSSVPKANGIWDIVNVQHTLMTMERNAPWFTTAILAPPSGAA